VVQNPVNVIEDIPLGDFRVVIVLAEIPQRPVGDVVPAFCAPFTANVKG
jgi:hypothetical protein